MMMTVTLAVTRAGSSETTVLYLSCSFPFCHMLTKGERGKIEMFLLCRRVFVMVTVVVVDIVSCESRGLFFELSFYLSGL